MTKTFIALAAAATIAAGAVSVPTNANAQCFGCGVAAGFGAGVLLSAAIANATPRYAYAPTYGYIGPRCFWQKQKIWTGFGWTFDRVRVCY